MSKFDIMKYQSYLPCKQLSAYVQALVISEQEEINSYKVLPNTGLVIGFQYRGNLSYILGEKEYELSSSGLTGLNDSFRIFKNSGSIGTVLVFFKEAGATAFFKEPLHELFRESISMDNFVLRSELLVLEEKLCAAKKDMERIRIVEDFLVGRLRDVKPDPLVLQAIAIFYQDHGKTRISEMIRQLNTSLSPFEKRFRSAVGASPKKFASIIRLKYAIQQFDPSRPLTELAHESGFYDQSHFIKEFKNFTGNLPEDYFQKKDK